jgi:hypothetical protein
VKRAPRELRPVSSECRRTLKRTNHQSIATLQIVWRILTQRWASAPSTLPLLRNTAPSRLRMGMGLLLGLVEQRPEHQLAVPFLHSTALLFRRCLLTSKSQGAWARSIDPMDAIERLRSAIPKSTTLFHYTSQAGLLGIIRSKSLWVSSIRHLSDAAESGARALKPPEERPGKERRGISWPRRSIPFPHHPWKTCGR